MERTSISEYIKSKHFVVLIAAIAVGALVLGSFSIGMAAGYRRARHSYAWGENYSKVFAGPRDGFMRGFKRDMNGKDFIDTHGTFGTIIKTDDSLLLVSGREGAEKAIVIEPTTVVRRFHDDIAVSELNVGDPIVVVGSPDDQGRIRAQLIRVMPMPPLPSGPMKLY